MKTINDLLQHGEFTVRDLGQKAIQYKDQLAKGLLARAEYDELCAQLTDLEALYAAANKSDDRQAIAEAVQFLIAFLKVVA